MSSSDIPKASGIYRITCTITGKFYIGSALDMQKRWREHRNDLRCDRHSNSKLQRAYQKHGEASFQFEILELVLLPEMLTAREQHYFDTLKPFGRRGFNLEQVAGSSLGRKHTPEARAKMSAAKRGRQPRLGKSHSPESRAKIGAASQGRKDRPETTQKRRESALKRAPRGPEAREKTRLANLGRPVSMTTRAKIGSANAKTLVFTSPDGADYVVTGLKTFCKEHHLRLREIMLVARGERPHHKGWKARFPDTNAG